MSTDQTTPDQAAPKRYGHTARNFRCPDELWQDAKSKIAERKAAGEDISTTAVLVAALEELVDPAPRLTVRQIRERSYPKSARFVRVDQEPTQ